MAKYICSECNCEAKSENLLRAHVCVWHLDDWSPYECRLCGESTHTADHMHGHLLAAHDVHTNAGHVTRRRDASRQRQLDDIVRRSLVSRQPVDSDDSAESEADSRQDEPEEMEEAITGDALEDDQLATDGDSETAEKPLEERKLSKQGRRLPTWQMLQRNSTYCIECERAVGVRAVRHVYAQHVRRHPYVCRLCSHGCFETNDMRTHFARRHADEHAAAFDDRRGEMEQHFLKAFLACYARRSDVDGPVVSVKVGKRKSLQKPVEEETPIKRRKDETTLSVESSPRNHSSERDVDSDNDTSIDSSPEVEVIDQPSTVIAQAETEPSRDDEPKVDLLKPDVYELDEALPKAKPTWQMLQRDTSFCHVCQAATGNSGPSDHVYTKHLKRKPFACSLCGQASIASSTVKGHIAKVHQGEHARIVDYRPCLKRDYEVMHAQCFRLRDTGSGDNHSQNESPMAVVGLVESPASSANGSSTSLNASQLSNKQPTPHALFPSWQMKRRDCSRCVLCSVAVKNCARLHIYKTHISQPAFRCSICARAFSQFSSGQAHLKNVHKDENGCVEDHRAELEPLYEQWHERCFALKKEFL